MTRKNEYFLKLYNIEYLKEDKQDLIDIKRYFKYHLQALQIAQEVSFYKLKNESQTSKQ